jgi:hypothetical protein
VNCLNERQLLSLNKKDLSKLKAVARMILEERAEVRIKKKEPVLGSDGLP